MTSSLEAQEPSETLASVHQATASEPQATAARPALRWVLTPHPDTLKRHITMETHQGNLAYRQAHPDLSWQIQHALQAHEVWVGMTRQEVIYAIGEATGSEAPYADGEGPILLYEDEGWAFHFNEDDYLLRYVER